MEESLSIPHMTHMERWQDTEWETFLASLTQQIDYLLAYHPDRLFAFFYSFDLDEQKVKQAFTQTEMSVAKALGLLIIQRLNEKVYFRKKYANTASESEE